SALSKYVAMNDRIMQTYSAFSSASSFVSPELTSKSEEFLDELAKSEELADYDYIIGDLIRLKKHVLSEKEEKGAGALDDAVLAFCEKIEENEAVSAFLGLDYYDEKEIY
ncbi:MAG: hypothetical protein IIW20_02330, partial [Clostridia bacterium]|nr:hypothetical protein [Clostridia bacterium]